jgi:ABC-type nitrate/sulfonate/bicarbonate transport system substrate-binding protein
VQPRNNNVVSAKTSAKRDLAGDKIGFTFGGGLHNSLSRRGSWAVQLKQLPENESK